MKSACTRRDGDIKPTFSSIFTQKCVGFTCLRKIGKNYLIRTADRPDRRHIVKCGALDSRECLVVRLTDTKKLKRRAISRV